MNKIISFFTAIIMFVLPFLNVPKTEAEKETWKTDYTYVFVHGLSGWGSYDFVDKVMPYWGMFGGSLMKYLKARGFKCESASVSGTASAWDRACELYAQLTGTVTDYGKEHSERCNHARYGRDFTGKPLVNEWNAENKINILGHSFGGATVRLFSEILANGSADEIKATPENELSDFFKGGKSDWIYSIISLAAPHNGTTAYNVDKSSADVEPTLFDKISAKLMSLAGKNADDGRIASDNADYDMYIDNALALNEKISTLKNVYYFSFACCAGVQNDDGTYSPDESKMERLFVASSVAMGKYTGVTEGGYIIDESWQKNDGLVNTISAMYPFGAPHTEFNENSVSKGIWNVMPIYEGDHMSLQGGMFVRNNVRTFYADLINMINLL